MTPTSDASEKPGQVDRLEYTATFRLTSEEDIFWGIAIEYRPVVDGKARPDLSGSFGMLDADSPAWSQFTKLLQMLKERLDPESIVVDGESFQLSDEITNVRINSAGQQIWLHLKSEKGIIPVIDRSELTPSQQSLFDNIRGSLDRLAWDDFRARIGASATADRPKILISYRRGHEKFAEAVAHRLGKEGLIPLYDRWESLAGDSIPGKISQWLAESVGCVIVVTGDYQSGKWATVEFDSAITKRAEGTYTVVPVLLEKCELPELLKYIQYVDFSDRDPGEFEAKMVEVINALYQIELNPYRR